MYQFVLSISKKYSDLFLEAYLLTLTISPVFQNLHEYWFFSHDAYWSF